MATKISYLNVENKMGETWNPVVGCTKCSPGCLNCYAEKMMYRQVVMGCARHEKNPDSNEDAWIAYSGVMDEDTHKWNGEVALRYDQLDAPLHWRKPRTILVPSMGDLFHPKVPFEVIHQTYRTIYSCEQHTFLLLTKRIKRAAEYYRCNLYTTNINAFPNLHLGVTICTPDEMWKVEELRKIPAAHRWISIEPMLEEIKLKLWQPRMERLAALVACRPVSHIENPTPEISYVVVGCESGSQRRPCKLEWIRSIVEQCKAAGVGCYVKQIPINGKVEKDISKFPEYLQVRDKI